MSANPHSLSRLQLVSRIGLIAAIPVMWMLTQAFEPARWLPLLVSLLVFGVPHGSVDLSVGNALACTGSAPPKRPGLFTCLLFAGYLSLAALYLVVWFGLPAAALGFFLLLTAWHWGTGDASWLAHQGRGAQPGTAGFLLDAGWRGAFPMALPLLLHPEVTASVLAGTLGLFGAVGPLDSLNLLLLALGGFGAACLGLSLLTSGHRRLNLVEAGMLVALFLILEPVAAIGLYFLFWHSLPHCARLADLLQPQRSGHHRSWVERMVGIHLRGLPYTLGALGMLGGLAVYLFQGGAPAFTPMAALGVYLVLLAIVTLPHAVITAWWDFAPTFTRTVVCSAQSTPNPATVPVAQP